MEGSMVSAGTAALSHDRMLQALLDAKSSIEDALSGQQERSSYITVLSADPVRVWEVASRLVADARRRVTCVCPPEGFTPARLGPAVEQFTAVSAQGVMIQLLLPTSASRATLSADWPTSPTASTRVTSQPLLEMLLVDDRVALIGFPAEPGYKSLLVRAPSILRVLSRLYGAAWQDARPLEEYSWASVVADCPVRSKVLRQLGSGVTDESAAQALGMSVRTYRRYVSELMQSLGAGSRFQAGLYARRAGLI